MNGTFDVIVGDFGRPATLRYLKEFSDAERDVIKGIIGQSAFYDEYRKIRFSLVGDLLAFKEDLLLAEAAARGPLSRRVLIGTDGGSPILDVLTSLSEGIWPWVRTALQLPQRPSIVRVVIPCNTLSCIAPKIECNLRKRSSQLSLELNQAMPLISVSGMVPIVFQKLHHQNVRYLSFVGTQVAYENYVCQAKRLKSDISISYAGRDIFDIAHRTSISGAPNIANHQTKDIFVGCSDIEIPGAIDGLRLYAQSLVHDTYFSGGLVHSDDHNQAADHACVSG